MRRSGVATAARCTTTRAADTPSPRLSRYRALIALSGFRMKVHDAASEQPVGRRAQRRRRDEGEPRRARSTNDPAVRTMEQRREAHGIGRGVEAGADGRGGEIRVAKRARKTSPREDDRVTRRMEAAPARTEQS